LDRLIVVVSLAGVFLGVGLSLYEFAFAVWGCSGTSCSPPFSYYLYTYYIPFLIAIVSLVTLVWGLRHNPPKGVGQHSQ
jgi:hypothetical protein